MPSCGKDVTDGESVAAAREDNQDVERAICDKVFKDVEEDSSPTLSLSALLSSRSGSSERRTTSNVFDCNDDPFTDLRYHASVGWTNSELTEISTAARLLLNTRLSDVLKHS